MTSVMVLLVIATLGKRGGEGEAVASTYKHLG
jgi:hypothetical protein